MKDAPNRPGMGYFNRDCETVEVEVSDPSLRVPQRASVRPQASPAAGRSVPPPVPSRGAHDAAAMAQAQALSQMQQLQIHQQMQLQQLQQMQMANQSAAAYAPTARAVVDAPAQDSDNRLKFLLFGLAIGAVVVLLLSGNGLANLRARLAYALMPDAPAAAPVQPVQMPVAAAPVAPPPTAIPVVMQPSPPPMPVQVAPRAVPEVDVSRLPKSNRGSRVARKSNDEQPTEIAAPPQMPQPQVDEPPVPGADPGIDIKAFQQLGKAFKMD